MTIEQIVATVGAIHLILTSATLLFVRDVRNTVRIAMLEERNRTQEWISRHFVSKDAFRGHSCTRDNCEDRIPIKAIAIGD